MRIVGIQFSIDWQTVVHYSGHLLVPFLVALIFFRKDWEKAGLVMLLAIFIDLDHLLASPIFDPERCSINFHPLHTYWAIAIYFLGLFYKKTRWIATGLILHISTDLLDCFWIFQNCHECYIKSAIHDIPFFTN